MSRWYHCGVALLSTCYNLPQTNLPWPKPSPPLLPKEAYWEAVPYNTFLSADADYTVNCLLYYCPCKAHWAEFQHLLSKGNESWLLCFYMATDWDCNRNSVCHNLWVSAQPVLANPCPSLCTRISAALLFPRDSNVADQQLGWSCRNVGACWAFLVLNS